MEATPRINMSPSARFVTASSMFDNIVGRPLSDKKIDAYILDGRYGDAMRNEALTELEKRKKKKRTRKNTPAPKSWRAKMMEEYV